MLQLSLLTLIKPRWRLRKNIPGLSSGDKNRACLRYISTHQPWQSFTAAIGKFSFPHICLVGAMPRRAGMSFMQSIQVHHVNLPCIVPLGASAHSFEGRPFTVMQERDSNTGVSQDE